ncbi:MAG: GGDEF domain-containing protein [Candidatus Omnitrophica bacterium]|nr:GGDEF domain-containing protein [Candidatus Omnitrophota bacterium]
MEEEIQRLKNELERVRSQLYVFYELTKAMRTTLRLDEIIYIILTGLTAHEGLRFNRAAIFFVNQEKKSIDGFMGIGPIDAQEAGEIWEAIEEDKKDLYDLIDNYRHVKKLTEKPKFMEFIQSLSFPLNKKSGLLFKALEKKETIHIKKKNSDKLKSDPIIEKLNLKESLILSLWIKGKPIAIMVVDNYITKQAISDNDLKTFNMFMEEAQGAIENSKDFENTLTKSHSDSLTGLWNYGYFQYKLDEELTNATSSKLPLSTMMIDLDDFKKFNDSRGHTQGDLALKKISQIIQKNCRKFDVLCRYGGEEFSLILPGSNKKDALLLGERIRKSIARSNFLESKFTVSIGISSFPEDATDKKTLIERADEALYTAKGQGKNRVVLA